MRIYLEKGISPNLILYTLLFLKSFTISRWYIPESTHCAFFHGHWLYFFAFSIKPWLEPLTSSSFKFGLLLRMGQICVNPNLAITQAFNQFKLNWSSIQLHVTFQVLRTSNLIHVLFN